MRPDLNVLEQPAQAAAEALARVAGQGGQVALTGGSTPREAYVGAAMLLDDWSSAGLWFTDERCVPPGHEHSNFRMASEALGDSEGLHRMHGELGAEQGAAAYEEELRASFPEADGPPRFDLVLLGLGPDAHTASLFPGAPELRERDRWVVGVDEPGMLPLVSRVTLTLPVLNAAREVLFLISGEEKADAVARAFGDRPAGPEAPAGLVDPIDGSLTVLLDAPAAQRLVARR